MVNQWLIHRSFIVSERPVQASVKLILGTASVHGKDELARRLTWKTHCATLSLTSHGVHWANKGSTGKLSLLTYVFSYFFVYILAPCCPRSASALVKVNNHHHQSSVINHQSSIISRQSSIISHQSSIINYQLSIINCQLSIVSFQLSVIAG